MERLQKKLVLNKKSYNIIRDFLNSHNYDLPADLVFEMFKIQALSFNFLRQIEISMKNNDDHDLVTFFADELHFLFTFNRLYSYHDTIIVKAFIKSLRKRERESVLKTYDLTPIESYVYSLIYNAQESNNVLSTSKIIDLVRKYKKYNIENESYLKEIIKKIRNKVAIDRFRARRKKNNF